MNRLFILNFFQATLTSQSSAQTNFHLKLEKLGQNVTKAVVETEEGNILFMEFNTNTTQDGLGNISESSSQSNIFTCVQCKVEFSKYNNFKRHINSHKTDPHQKGLQCHFCSRYWSSMTALRRHERTHTGKHLENSAFK